MMFGLGTPAGCRWTTIAVGLLLLVATDANAGQWPLLSEGAVADYFAETTYDPAVPSPDSVLGYPLGSRPTRYDEAINYLRVLSDMSPRVEMIEIGRTYEGRTLYTFIVSHEDNIAQRESIRADLARLTRPNLDGTIPGEQDIVSGTPAVAWMGYSIHGDEISGVDAALWTAYHLAAATDEDTRRIRENVVTLIDPSQNPDGRERYLAQVYAYTGAVPSSYARDLQHEGFWPWGRANHYLFDLNRDWLPLVHPETNARVSVINAWSPQIAVDAHEMGAYSTYLFSPGREPLNANITKTIRRWWDVFAADQGSAFDQRGWSYYTGDWHEEWYPGYGSAWTLFTGAIGILYEQAGTGGSPVRKYSGDVLHYSQCVAQQTVSSLANLQTVAQNRARLLSDYADFHRDGITGRHEGLRGAFILAPGENTGREQRFVSTILRHGLQLIRATSSFAADVVDGYSKKARRTFPAGTYLIPLQQPRGLLAKAMLEFDPHLSPQFLQEERREVEKGNDTRLYEVTSWSLALAYDLDITYAASIPAAASEAVLEPPSPGRGKVLNPEPTYGFLIPTIDDRSMNALVRIFDAGLSVRASLRPFVHQEQKFAAGTLLLRKHENGPDLEEALRAIAGETGVTVIGSSTNYSSGDPDLGSDLFEVLRVPRIGMFIGSDHDFTSVGVLWYLLDFELRSRMSLLDIGQLSDYDLSAFNVLILPSYWGDPSSRIGDEGAKKLSTWVEQGGTLIAEGSSAFFCADSSSGLSAARERGDVLEDISAYERAVAEERAARTATVDSNAVWNWSAGKQPGDKREDKEADTKDADALRHRDDRARLFQPRGVIMQLELNSEHWLTFGAAGRASAIVYTKDALMVKPPVQAAARIADAGSMRMAGLLWPESRQRWANTAYATRESKGKGQVILFADSPYFRSYFHGTKRLFLNACLLGPGLGTSAPPPW